MTSTPPSRPFPPAIKSTPLPKFYNVSKFSSNMAVSRRKQRNPRRIRLPTRPLHSTFIIQRVGAASPPCSIADCGNIGKYGFSNEGCSHFFCQDCEIVVEMYRQSLICLCCGTPGVQITKPMLVAAAKEILSQDHARHDAAFLRLLEKCVEQMSEAQV